MHSLLSDLEGYDHIIWDWNGTLLGDVEHNVRTMNQLLAEAGLPAISIADHRAQFGFPVVEYYARLGFDISPASYDKLCERFNSLFYAGLHDCELVPGARDVIEQLHASGHVQSVLSATRQETLEAALQQFDLLVYFDYVFGIATDHAHSKLERGRELVHHSGIPTSRTVLVGDTDHDLEVGRAIGVKVILVEHGHQSRRPHW